MADLYKQFAAKIHQKSEDAVTYDERQAAKRAFYVLVYDFHNQPESELTIRFQELAKEYAESQDLTALHVPGLSGIPATDGLQAAVSDIIGSPSGLRTRLS